MIRDTECIWVYLFDKLFSTVYIAAIVKTSKKLFTYSCFVTTVGTNSVAVVQDYIKNQ